jgi:hypothetical protein
MEIVKARWREITNRAVTEDEAVSYKKGWQRDRLAVIHNDPPDDWRVRYERLVAEVGPSEDLIHAKESTASWYVPSSPKTSQELSEMTVTEIVQFLKTWQPSNEFMSASISGLGDQLAAAVAANPEKFGQEAQQFKDLDPTYVKELLRALCQCARQKQAFNWKEVLGLCRWVTDQPREILDRRVRLRDRDPDWGWTRSEIARLLSAGFATDAIPIELRYEVWEILERLTEDVNPEPEEEESYLEEGSYDPTSLSMNEAKRWRMLFTMPYGSGAELKPVIRRRSGYPQALRNCQRYSAYLSDTLIR